MICMIARELYRPLRSCSMIDSKKIGTKLVVTCMHLTIRASDYSFTLISDGLPI